MAMALAAVGCGQDSGQEAQAYVTESENGTAAPVSVNTQDGTEPEGDIDIFEGIQTAENGAKVSIHDPSIKVFDGKYYLYGSHMAGAYSEDMQTWTYIGNGYTPGNPLFENLFAEGLGVFDYAGTYENGSHSVWAEDVIYIEEMQKYVMYFCTSSTYIKSKLCYATADRPEGPYAYQGTLLYSGFTAQDIEDTDVYEYVDSETAEAIYLSGGQYNNILWPNCIDPAPFYDGEASPLSVIRTGSSMCATTPGLTGETNTMSPV